MLRRSRRVEPTFRDSDIAEALKRSLRESYAR